MTHTKPRPIERAQETSPPQRRGAGLWILLVVLAVVAAVVVAAVLLWPDGDETVTLGNDAPFGLAEIEMPTTEVEVLAILQALPAIDGRQPYFDAAVRATSYEPYPQGDWLGIGVLPLASDPLETLSPEVRKAEGATIEASALDPEGELLWMEFNHGEQTFSLEWADPAGPWAFIASGDTIEFRTQLIEAFISAAGR